ncbi:MAG: N-acetylmuramoyl-L-alanine amidase [Chloroflexi bacterium]|nr:N-acetylmuramoyl-L-alanine amidase [Chloroflexota bacterium]
MNRLSRSLVALAVAALLGPVPLAPMRPIEALAAPLGQEVCSRPNEPPPPVPGDPNGGSFWGRYRQPLPPAEVYNPPGPKRVGLQAGHWRVEETPAELRGLGPGASGGGRAEWEVNLDLAERTATILRAHGVVVDILPSTIPVEYKAHVFLSIHADGDEAGVRRGYKLGRAAWSATPEADDRLMAAITDTYGPATALPVDPVGASRRMTAYYAFNSRRYCHAIAPGTPSAILEAGYLTSAVDRQILLVDPEAAARGIAAGILRFLEIPREF